MPDTTIRISLEDGGSIARLAAAIEQLNVSLTGSKFGAGQGGIVGSLGGTKKQVQNTAQGMGNLSQATQRASGALGILALSSRFVGGPLSQLAGMGQSISFAFALGGFAGLRLANVFRLLAVGLGVSGLVGLLSASIQHLTVLEDRLLRAAIASNKFGEEAHKFVISTFDTVIKRSRELGVFGPKQLVLVGEAAVKAGFSVTDAFGAAGEAVLKFARISEQVPQEAANQLLNTQRLTGLALTEISDLIVQTAAATTANEAMLSEAFAGAAFIFRRSGATAVEFASLLGLLDEAGLKGSQAARGVRRLFEQLDELKLKTTTEKLEILSSRGLLPLLRSFKLGQIGAFQFAQGIAKANLSAAELQALFDTFGARPIQALTDLGRRFEDIKASVSRFHGVTEKANETLNQGLKGSVEGLGTAWERFTTKISDSKSLVSTIHALTAAVEALSDALYSPVAVGTVGALLGALVGGLVAGPPGLALGAGAGLGVGLLASNFDNLTGTGSLFEKQIREQAHQQALIRLGLFGKNEDELRSSQVRELRKLEDQIAKQLLQAEFLRRLKEAFDKQDELVKQAYVARGLAGKLPKGTTFPEEGPLAPAKAAVTNFWARVLESGSVALENVLLDPDVTKPLGQDVGKAFAGLLATGNVQNFFADVLQTFRDKVFVPVLDVVGKRLSAEFTDALQESGFAKDLATSLGSGLAGLAVGFGLAVIDLLINFVRNSLKKAENESAQRYLRSFNDRPTVPVQHFAFGGVVGGAGSTDTVPVQHFAFGGVVGGAGSTDTVPALLTPGEVVLPPDFIAALPITPTNRYATSNQSFQFSPVINVTGSTNPQETARVVSEKIEQLWDELAARRMPTRRALETA